MFKHSYTRWSFLLNYLFMLSGIFWSWFRFLSSRACFYSNQNSFPKKENLWLILIILNIELPIPWCRKRYFYEFARRRKNASYLFLHSFELFSNKEQIKNALYGQLFLVQSISILIDHTFVWVNRASFPFPNLPLMHPCALRAQHWHIGT